MQLHEKIFNGYVTCFLVALLIVIGIPITLWVRAFGLPLLAGILFQFLPSVIYSLITDPLLAVSAVVVFVFLWAAVLTLGGYQWSASDHRRGRIVQSNRSEDFEEALRRRHRARVRSVDESDEPQIGVRRPKRYGSYKREYGDED